MKNYRNYGERPYNILTLHGGPGAVGELKELSQKISEKYGVIEYLQKKESIKELKEEMKEIIKSEMDPPVKIVGFSWGAWLAVLFTAKYSSLIDTLVLISSGPFEESYSQSIHENRINRMNSEEKELFQEVKTRFKKGKNPRIKLLRQFIKLMHKVDAYEYMNNNKSSTNFNIKLYKKIWSEAARLRKENYLLKSLGKIDCPIKIIHGKYDPHPYQGVVKPIKQQEKNYEFTLLEKCGHTPWREKYAEDEFYNTLFNYLK